MLFRRFRSDRRGAITPTFALMMIPLMAAIGSAVDYGMAAKVRTQLLAAADAASVGSVGKASPALSAAANSDVVRWGPSRPARPTPPGSSMPRSSGRRGSRSAAPPATVTKAGSTVTSVVKFTAQVPTHFMGLFGISSVPVSGNSTAANGTAGVHRFLSAARQHAVDGRRRDDGRHQHHGQATRRTNARLPVTTCRTRTTITSLRRRSMSPMRIDVLRTATQQLMDTARRPQRSRPVPHGDLHLRHQLHQPV